MFIQQSLRCTRHQGAHQTIYVQCNRLAHAALWSGNLDIVPQTPEVPRSVPPALSEKNPTHSLVGRKNQRECTRAGTNDKHRSNAYETAAALAGHVLRMDDHRLPKQCLYADIKDHK